MNRERREPNESPATESGPVTAPILGHPELQWNKPSLEAQKDPEGATLYADEDTDSESIVAELRENRVPVLVVHTPGVDRELPALIYRSESTVERFFGAAAVARFLSSLPIK